MEWLRAVGMAVTCGGLGAYGIGIWISYPGRGFSIAAVMIGLTLVAIGGSR